MPFPLRERDGKRFEKLLLKPEAKSGWFADPWEQPVEDADAAGVEKTLSGYGGEGDEVPESTPSSKDGDDKPHTGGIPYANPFQLVAHLTSFSSEPAGDKPNIVSRYELVARIAAAAEALQVRSLADGGEVRVELKEGVLPETSIRIRRDVGEATLVVEFTTSNSKVNLFLENSAAALRGQLEAKFSIPVTVQIHAHGGQDNSRHEQGDERGRRPDWDRWNIDDV
ncbi:MAG: hypothetical protein LUC93_14620 [Planctomycetaceae bacterium]|nr:hypothetical protein [Planctomycetaceae bacterium]